MYLWFVVIHLAGLVLFLLTHGVSMWAVFRVRRDPDPEAARLLLGLSATANRAMYGGLLLLGIGGLGAAWNNGLLLAPWVVASYVVLVVIMIAMWAAGAGFYYPLREALGASPGGATIDAEELARRVANRRPEVLALFGVGGLLVLVWLMVMKPS